MDENAEKRKWTIMIYLAGDNNLSDEMIWALKEMFRVGTGGLCNVVVQFDPSSPYQRPRRYDLGRIEKIANARADVDGILDLSILKQVMIEGCDPEETSNPAVLRDFLQWTFLQPDLQAEHYMLILSGHGSGAGGVFLQDDSTGSSLTIKDFGETLTRALKPIHRKIDILGLDCCALSTAELGHQVHEVVDYLVGAEGFTPEAGWPYHRLLECLRMDLGPEDLAKKIVEKYILYYSDYLAADISTDQAAVHVGDKAWDRLIRHIKQLSGELSDALRKSDQKVINALVLAHWAAQSYEYEQNVDLYDFCRLLRHYLRGANQESIRKACSRLIRQWNLLVSNSLYTGPSYQHSHGLSLYFPWCEVAASYGELSFAKETGWGEFLKLYVQETCREMRNDEKIDPKRVRPKTLESAFDDGFVNPCGLKVYRPDGSGDITSVNLDSVRGGGLHSTRGGGPHSARGGGLHSARGGGPHSARWEGLESARLIARLASMKNFPAGFYPPEIPDRVNDRNLKRKCIEANTGSLKDEIGNCSDEVLRNALEGLEGARQQEILGILQGLGARNPNRPANRP